LQAVFLIFGGLNCLLLLGRLVVTDAAIEAAERNGRAAQPGAPAPAAPAAPG
jgi:hypothetical protein